MTFAFALKQLLFTVGVPAVVSGILYLILRTITPKASVPLAVAIGYISGHLALQGLPKFPPSTIFHYLPYLALGTLLWTLLERFWPKNLIARWSLRTLVLLALLLYMLRRIIQNSWQLWETILWLAGILLVFLVVWWLLERLSQGESALRPPLFLTALVMLVTGSSITLAATGSVVLSQLAGVLAASIGAIIVLSWLMNIEVTPSLAAVFIFLQGGLWVGGAVFSKLPVLSALILTLSPLLLLLIRPSHTLRNTLLRLVLFAIPIVAVAGFALIEFLREQPF
jgi:hypothetical protein